MLVNSNPATIMTDPELADRTYVEPLTADALEKIIEKERPDALLPTVGGQTALNLAVQLDELGVLKKYDVELIGAQIPAIKVAEDRLLFKNAMREIGIDMPSSGVVKSLDEALAMVEETGFPAIIRPSFTMGGVGGGIAYNLEEFKEICARGLSLSPVHEVLVEESVIGWKEFELEVMRDGADNFVVICSIENIDPMGVHTGDSITVAPALTLTDKEYQRMRDAARRIIRRVGVETGGSNIQFAVNPADGRMTVIEMNPRVSRSSALASKATGFPIAKIAAKLALGYRLDEIPNDITRVTPASFEPTIDYIVVKIPRWNFEKFPQADRTLTTQMKSVGEAMSIGRTFKEAFLKGIRSLEMGKEGLLFRRPAADEEPRDRGGAGGRGRRAAAPPGGADRPPDVGAVPRARQGLERRAAARADRRSIPGSSTSSPSLVELRRTAEMIGLREMSLDLLRTLKRAGFGDQELAEILGVDASAVRERRLELGLVPAYKRIDTCAAEFESFTPYMYSSLRGELRGRADRAAQGDHPGQRAQPHRPGHRVRLLLLPCRLRLPEGGLRDDHGQLQSGDRVHRLRHGRPAVLRAADLRRRDGRHREGARGQSRRGLRRAVRRPDAAQAGAVAAGSRREDPRDFAGLDRPGRRSAALRAAAVGPRHPAAGERHGHLERRRARVAAARVGFPVVVRPSYVLGGRNMAIVYDVATLDRYMASAVDVSHDRPILIDRFLEHAKEIDVDCVADATGAVVIGGIMEHIEEAGIHSGDSSCVVPPPFLAEKHLATIRDYTRRIAPRAEGGRPDERAVRHQGRHGLRARGQPARVAHRAVPGQGDRRAAGADCGARDGGPDAGLARR